MLTGADPRVEGGLQGQVNTAVSSFPPQRSTQFCILFQLTSPPKVSMSLNNGLVGGAATRNCGAGAKRTLEMKMGRARVFGCRES